MPDPIPVDDDPVVVQVTTTETDENGNTVVTGYPSGGGAAYDGPVNTEGPGGAEFGDPDSGT